MGALSKFRIIHYTFLQTSPEPWEATYFDTIGEARNYVDEMIKLFPADIFIYQMLNGGRYWSFGCKYNG